MQATTELSDAEIDRMDYLECMVWALQRQHWELAALAARFADERATTVSRKLQSLPAVMTPEDLWAAGFRTHALYPTGFRP